MHRGLLMLGRRTLLLLLVVAWLAVAYAAGGAPSSDEDDHSGGHGDHLTYYSLATFSFVVIGCFANEVLVKFIPLPYTVLLLLIGMVIGFGASRDATLGNVV